MRKLAALVISTALFVAPAMLSVADPAAVAAENTKAPVTEQVANNTASAAAPVPDLPKEVVEKMKLNEERFARGYIADGLPDELKDLAQTCGYPLAIEIDWMSFVGDFDALQNLQHQGVGRLTCAVKSICGDEVGKGRMAKKVKKLVVKNVSDIKEKKVVVGDGQIQLIGAFGKGSEGYYPDNEIQKIIEDAL